MMMKLRCFVIYGISCEIEDYLATKNRGFTLIFYVSEKVFKKVLRMGFGYAIIYLD